MPELDFLRFELDFSAPATVSAYDELPLWSAMFGLLLLDEVPLERGARVLDVGCGTGFPAIELAERLGPSSEVHAIDPWAAALERAAEKLRHRVTPNVTLHEGSATALPFPASHFDLIVSNLGVNNFDDRVGALRECRRVARPAATIALTTNLQGHMEELYDAFENVLANDAAALQRLREHVAHRATIASVKTLLMDAGFDVRRVVERNGTMRFADGTALLNHHFIKLGFLDGWKGVAGPNLEPVFARLLEELNRKAAVEGELRLKIPMAYIEAVAV